MKVERLEKIFITLTIFISLFYMTADFSKVISKQLGLAQLIFFIALSVISKNNIPKIIYFLYAIVQIVPIYCYFGFGFDRSFWVYRFNNDNFIIKVNSYLGILFHIIIIIFASYIIYLKREKSKGEKNADKK